MDPKCPLALWDLMLPQIDMQVNLLRQSNITPKISAYAHLHGQHDFNRQPLAPLGVEVHVYVPPENRHTWSVKTKKGFYVETSTEHYRYYKAYIPETGSIQGTETMFFKHKYITMPALTAADAVVQAARDLIEAMKGKLPPPLAQPSTEQIKTLASIFTPSTPSIEAQQQASPQEVNKQQTPANSPRVGSSEGAPRPRVRVQQVVGKDVPALIPRDEDADSDNEEDVEEVSRRMIVASQIVASGAATDQAAAAAAKAKEATAKHLATKRQGVQRFIQDRQSGAPADNTRSKRTITDEIMLSCLEMSNAKISPRSASSRKYPLGLLIEMAGAVLDSQTGELLEYRHLVKNPIYREVWGTAMGKEVGRLAQGLPGVVEGTDTLEFISKDEIPPDRWKDVTYARIVCNYRPEKADPNRV